MAIIDNFTQEELAQIVAESFSYREVLLKLGYRTAGGSNHLTLKDRIEKYNITTSHFTSNGHQIKRTEDNVLCEHSTASQATLRRWMIKGNYIDYKCSICGLQGLWQGKPLNLQLDHVNGNNSDNRISNLRWLCPNCHSQTETFCGKQTQKNHATKDGIQIIPKSEKVKYCIDCGKIISHSAIRCENCSAIARRHQERPSAEQLEQEIRATNFVEVGKKYGVRDNTIRKWCKAYGLPTKADYYHSK